MFPACRVIVLTGHPQAGGMAEILDRGASECLTKPPDIEGLADLIRRAHLEDSGAADPAGAWTKRDDPVSDLHHPPRLRARKRRTS